MMPWVQVSSPSPGSNPYSQDGGNKKQSASFYEHDPDTAPHFHSHPTGQSLVIGLYFPFLQKPVKDWPLQQL